MVKKLLLSLALVVGIYTVNIPAVGNTYYVAKTGSDSNTCAQAQSTSTPKLTINAGVGCLVAGHGDTLLVRTGVYNEHFRKFESNIIPSGTSWSNKTRIAAYPNGCATTCESVTIAPSPSSTIIYAIIWFTSGEKYIEFDGINLDTRPSNRNQMIAFNGGDNPALPGTPSSFIRFQYLDAVVPDTTEGPTSGIFNVSNASSEFLHLTVHGMAVGYAFYVQGSNNLFEFNDIYDTALAGLQNYTHTTGLTGSNNIYRNNRFHDINSSYFFTTAVDGRLWGIIIANGDGNWVYNNLFYHMNYPGSDSWHTGVTPGSDTGRSVLALGSGATNTHFWNNTVYDNRIGAGWNWTSPGPTEYINNISYANFDNTFYLNGQPGTIANNLITTNPLFTNAATRDFSLQAGSPARNTGRSTTFFSTDFIGTARPQECCWDIGAYEFVVSTTPPPITPVVMAITAPVASNATYETTTSPLTTFAGTASGGTLTSCTWTNTNGGSGSGTATGTTTWSVASITLTANAINHLTTTCSNTSGGVSSAAIDVYYVPAAGSVTDNFNRANWPTLGPNWTTQTTGVNATIANNQAVSTISGEVDEFFSGFAAPNNQCTQATIRTVSATQNVGVFVRASGTGATLNNYQLWTDGTSSHFVKIVSGTVTSLGTSSTTWVSGNVIKLCVVSQSLQAYRDGIAVGSPITVTSPTLSSGAGGIELVGVGAALDDFSGSSAADTTPPTIAITAPSTSGSYTATSTPLTLLAGIAADNIAVSSVTWVNSAGGSGTATGTTSWSVASISLTAGTNNITVTAHDAAGNTTPTIISVNYIPPTPTTPPIVTITSFNTNYETGSSTLTSLAGTSFSSGGTITGCTWANTVGGSGSGSTTGTTSWTVPSITLAANVINRIIVTCVDDMSQTGSAQVDVLYVPPPSSAADNFNRTNWPTLGPNWTAATSAVAKILSNQANGVSTSSHYMLFTSWALTNDQCSQATIRGLTSAVVGTVIRANGSSSYLLATDGSSGAGHTYIGRVISGTITQLGALSTTYTTGDTVKLCVIGTSLQAYKNGSAIGSPVSDSSLTSGYAGIYLAGTAAAVDDFIGSNTSGSVPNNLPIAAPGGPYTGVHNVAVKVDASHSIAQRGVLKRYVWQWGDGTSDSSVKKPITTHTFTAAGTYTITLTVTDSRNQTSLPVSTTVTVS